METTEVAGTSEGYLRQVETGRRRLSPAFVAAVVDAVFEFLAGDPSGAG